MVRIEIVKCWYNIYSSDVCLDFTITTLSGRLKPMSFSIEVPEMVLALLRITPLFKEGVTESNELAGDWTGQTWTITLNTTT